MAQPDHSLRSSAERHGRRPAVAAAAALLALLAACTTVLPPDPAALHAPCTVHVARELGHLALFLPDRAGRDVEYGFGDRIYLSTPGWRGQAWAVLLCFDPFPTPGALIREERGDLRLARIRAAGATLLTFDVERASMESLRARLDEQWSRGSPCGDWTALHRSDGLYELWAWNCQNVGADWLRALGCTISPWRIVPRWYEWSLGG